MKKSIIFLSIIIISIFYSVTAKSQCQEYIEAIAEYELEPYKLDGNFLSPIIYEGDTVSLTRTFLAGNKYKISVVGMDMFVKYVTITDADGFIVFKNYPIGEEVSTNFTSQSGEEIADFGSNFWEFTPTESQNLKILVEIEQIATKQKLRIQGCLGIIVGFL